MRSYHRCQLLSHTALFHAACSLNFSLLQELHKSTQVDKTVEIRLEPTLSVFLRKTNALCLIVFIKPFLQSIIAWIMLLPNSSSFETLINYFSFAAWVFYGCTVSALLWLRYKKPEMKRPYKVSHDFIDSTQFSNKLNNLVRRRPRRLAMDATALTARLLTWERIFGST